MNNQTEIEILESTVRILEEKVRELEAELRSRDLDPLTGLYNLRWLREFWDADNRPVIGAVAYLDVDLLKPINDRYGHQVGDRVLTHVAANLITSGCYGVRHGGDEFLLLIPAGRNPVTTMNQIIADIMACPVPVRGGEIHVVVSCGVRVASDERPLHELIGDADSAMYAAKRQRSGAQGCRVFA